MSLKTSFVEACLEGDRLPDEIDDFVEEWHNGESELPLSDFLGFTQDEYALWVESPDALESILIARKTGKTIHEMLADQ